MNISEFYEEISYIQKNLKAPKGQFNAFGKYKYRSCEDIVEGLKQVMPDGFILIISDEIKEVGGRIYVEATAKITNGEHEVSNKALARESEAKKGMDDSQVTGASSSYARKYALNGLLCIDDTKDADTQEPVKNENRLKELKEKGTVIERIKKIAGQKTQGLDQKLKADFMVKNLLVQNFSDLSKKSVEELERIEKSIA